MLPLMHRGDSMLSCTQCGSAMPDTHEYCGKCGKKIDSYALLRRVPFFRRIPNKNSETVGSLGRFGQLFGLDPRVAFLTLIVDMMLNAGDLLSMGLLLPVSAAAGVVLGYVVYRAQINWYGDDKESGDTHWETGTEAPGRLSPARSSRLLALLRTAASGGRSRSSAARNSCR